MSDTNQIIRQELLDSSNKHKRQQRKNSGEFENQISSDGSQPNPQDDMNSQKVEDEGLASDLAKTMTERPQNQHQQVNKAAVLNCDATEMQQLKILLQQRGLPLKDSTLEVKVVPDSIVGTDGKEVEANRVFKMDETDLQNSFKQFGEIVKIEVEEQSGYAYITFSDVIDATLATMYMHDCRLEKSQATLSVKYCKSTVSEEKKQEKVQIPTPTPIEDQKAQLAFQQQQYQIQVQQTQYMLQQQQQQMQAQYQMMMPPTNVQAQPFKPTTTATPFQPTMQFQSQQFGSTFQPQPFHPQMYQNQQQDPNQFEPFPKPTFDMNQPARPFKPASAFQGRPQAPEYDPNQSEEDQGVKYTCRYEIQIDNEREFQVARRVIGSKGANMKRIIEECAVGFDQNVNAWEIVKLRLRGHGSGFKEGPNKEESQDPLNLCISSKYKEKYEYACSEMERLLKEVYVDYRKFYQYKKNRPRDWDCDKFVKKEETVTRPKPNAEAEEIAGTDQTQNGMAQILASLNQLTQTPMNGPHQSNQMASLNTMNSFQPNQYHIPQNTPSFYPKFPQSNQKQMNNQNSPQQFQTYQQRDSGTNNLNGYEQK